MHAMQVLRNTMHRALNPRCMTAILVLHGVPVLPVNSTWPLHFSICFKLFRVLTQIWCARTRCVDPRMVCLSLVKQDCQESNPIIYGQPLSHVLYLCCICHVSMVSPHWFLRHTQPTQPSRPGNHVTRKSRTCHQSLDFCLGFLVGDGVSGGQQNLPSWQV